MDARHQLKPTTCACHARKRASMGVYKYELHNKLTTVTMPLPFRRWLTFGVDLEP